MSIRSEAVVLVLAIVAVSVMAIRSRPPDASNRPTAHAPKPKADVVAELNRRILTGDLHLSFDPTHGYLPSVLAALDIPIESQTLVHSKTSRQRDLISAATPRALFFNDSTSVGAVPGGDVLEVVTHDPARGLAFYTLAQAPKDTPQFAVGAQCSQCHILPDTGGVPGLLMRSQAPPPEEPDGPPRRWAVDHRTPFVDRWGGWYVTGAQVPAGHLGNLWAHPAAHPGLEGRLPPALPLAAGPVDPNAYLTPHSDIVALLILTHQVEMTNLLTRLGWEVRRIEHEGASTTGRMLPRVRELAREVVDYMLFVDEARLPGAVRGASGFAQVFSSSGPRDAKGRSLRDLDLAGRLLRYPFSYMIHSEAFDDLPPLAKRAVYERLREVLSGGGGDPVHARIPTADRQVIVEILADTKEDLAPYLR